MPPSSSAYNAGLLALQQQQRASLTALIEQVDGTLASNWQQGVASAAGVYGPILDQYAKDLSALRIANDDPAAALTLDWLTSQNTTLASIEQSVQQSLTGFAQSATATVTNAQAAVSQVGASDAAALTQRSLWPAVEGAGVPPAMLFNRPNPDAIAQWVGRAGNGHPLGDLFANFGSEATQAARQSMMLGLLTGANPKAMASGISQAMGISRSRAAIIARTEVLGSYRSAAHETYRANADVLNGWIWSAGGSSPCACCMGMDGLQFSLEEELIDHVCGKCAPLPCTKSWDDILGPLGIDSSGMMETSIGEPGAYETGPEKFARMTPEQQRSVIGTKTGYEAYQRGEVTLKDFIGQHPATADGFPAQYYQKSLREMEIPTRQARQLVEPDPRLQELDRMGKLRANMRGFPIPVEEMPVWAQQSQASQAVYQIMRNGLPYDMTEHEIPLLSMNLQQMLTEDLPLNVREAALRQLDQLKQYDAYLEANVRHVTTGLSTRGAPDPFVYKPSRELQQALADARAGGRGVAARGVAARDVAAAAVDGFEIRMPPTISEVAARDEVRVARTSLNNLNRKLDRALASDTATHINPDDVAKFTANNAEGVPDIGYHAGTPEHILRLDQQGIDVAHNLQGTWGRGFYMHMEYDATMRYGSDEVRVAIHMQKPFVIDNPKAWQKLVDKFAKGAPHDWDVVMGRFTDDLIAKGYDGIIVRAEQFNALAGTPGADLDEIIAIKPGTVRVIGQQAAKDVSKVDALTRDIARAKNVLEQAQAKLDAQIAERKVAEAAATVQAKAQAAAEKLVARDAAKAAKLAERQAAKDAAVAEKSAAERALRSGPQFTTERVAEQQLADERKQIMSLIGKNAKSDALARRTKAQVARDIAARLENNSEFNLISDTFAKLYERELKSYGYSAEDIATGIASVPHDAEGIVRSLISSWAGGYEGAENGLFVALQQAIRDEFSLENVAKLPGTTTKILRDWQEAQPGLRAFMREMYNNTQDYLKVNHITEIPVYRGMGFERLPSGMGIKASMLDGQVHEVQIGLRAASSFSADAAMALSFANTPVADINEVKYAMVLAGRVPAEAVLGIPQTGFGALKEFEVVALGGVQDVVMVGTTAARGELTADEVASLLVAPEHAAPAADLAVQEGETVATGGGVTDAVLTARIDSIPADASVADIQDWVKTQIPNIERVDLTTLDAQTARLVANATGNLIPELPDVANNLWRIQAENTYTEALAFVPRDGASLIINTEKWADLAGVAERAPQYAADGWWVSETPEQIIGHEIGHMVQLNYNISNDTWEAALDTVAASGGNPLVSQYAGDKIEESFAETFALLVYGEPTDAQMAITQEMARLLDANGIDYARLRAAVGSPQLDFSIVDENNIARIADSATESATNGMAKSELPELPINEPPAQKAVTDAVERGSVEGTDMRYVARFTMTPEYDVERNWVGYIAFQDADRAKVAEQVLDSAGVDTEQAYHDATYLAEQRGREAPEYSDWIEAQLEAHDLELRYNTAMGKWVLFHHEGLSVWALDAQTAAAAKAEALTGDLSWHGFGQMTDGAVAYVGPIDNARHLHLFVAEDVANEPWE